MPGLIPQHQIEEIRAVSDIAEVVGERVPLKSAGSTLKALCPFHKEKTPSFNVNRHRQTFHCFGCGEGGDVYAFIMRYEGVDFLTAVQMLAQRAGVAIEFSEGEQQDRRNKNALYDLLDKTAQLYHRALRESPAAAEARTYLKARGLDGSIAEEWVLGYAPDQRNAVADWARKKGHSLQHLEDTGLAGADTSRGAYDRFRDRLMFPIRDELGRTVGFSGRLIKKGSHPAKYVNSPETPVFKKSRLLYGLDRARRHIADRGTALVCEGQIDVIRCHACGFEHAVAPQGTALTDDHARLIKRYADSVLLLFDSDAAGIKAALRSAEVLLGADLDVRLAAPPEGEDPDSLLLNEGAEALQALLDQARELVDFQLDALARNLDLQTPAGQRRAAQEVVALAGRTPGEVQREQMLQRAAERLGLHATTLQRDVQRLSRGRYTASSGKPDTPAPRPPDTRPGDEIAFVELLLEDESLTDQARVYVPPTLLEDPLCRRIVEALYAGDEPGGLLDRLAGEPDSVALVARLQADSRVASMRDTSVAEALHELILALHRKILVQQRRSLMSRQAQAEGPERDRLSMACSELTLDIKRLDMGWEVGHAVLDMARGGTPDTGKPA